MCLTKLPQFWDQSHSLKGCSYDPDGAESEAPKYESQIIEEYEKQQSMLLNTDVKLLLLHVNVLRYVYKHADLRPWDPRNDMLQ